MDDRRTGRLGNSTRTGRMMGRPSGRHDDSTDAGKAVRPSPFRLYAHRTPSRLVFESCARVSQRRTSAVAGYATVDRDVAGPDGGHSVAALVLGRATRNERMPISARSASVAAGHDGSGSGRLLAFTPSVVEANHLPPVPEQRAHRADRCDGHLPATMTTCAVDGDEKGCASHAVDRQGAGHWTLLQPSLFAENRPSSERGVIARWWEEDGIEREPCRDDNALPCAAVPDGEQDERC
jgi:hypothetical protein